MIEWKLGFNSCELLVFYLRLLINYGKLRKANDLVLLDVMVILMRKAQRPEGLNVL